jgi:Holliday junction resolvase
LSFRAKKSKNKGASFEAEVVNKLREIGFTDCCRAAGQDKRADNNKIDVVDPSGKLPINI